MAKATTPKKRIRHAVNSNALKNVMKVLAIYMCLLFIYEFWLLPNGSLDEWLTTNIVDTTAGILSGFKF